MERGLAVPSASGDRLHLEQTISRLIEPLAVQAQQKGLELAIDINQQTPLRLLGDSHRLGQVIIN
ncbi:MAG: hypothetical protein ACYS1C_10975, partial [Planctomycetota bacterium]